MPLKIGIVTEYYYPLLGGTTENVHHTWVGLKRLGHEVKIITSHANGTRSAARSGDYPRNPDVIRVGRSVPVYSEGSFGYVTIGRKLGRAVERILDEGKFDLLHLQSPTTPILPIVATLKARVPLVGTFHSYFEKSQLYSLFKEPIQRKILNRLNGKIAVSQCCVTALARYFDIHARVIHNGVDVEQFSPSIAPFNRFNDGRPNLLFLGRLDPRNGFGFMLRVFGLVKSEFRDARLIVVGDGPLSWYYRRRVPEELKQDIFFAGPVLGERPQYYASCDVFCSPLSTASFGITLLEAMASGKPIVAMENVGYKEILGSREGVLTPAGDAEAFAKAVICLLRDRDLRAQMGAEGRARAQSFSWPKLVGEIAGYYSEVLNGRKT